MAAAVASAQVTITKAAGQGVLFVLVDSDDDCAVTLAQAIQNGVTKLGFSHPFAVVACVREYESWFLVAASSLQGAINVRRDAKDVVHAEAVRDAKGMLERDILVSGRSYSPTVDQPDFSTRLDPKKALASRSFRKLVKELHNAIAQ